MNYEVETDDLDVAVILTQKGCVVAFFSRTLQELEKRHATVEKETRVIIDVRH